MAGIQLSGLASGMDTESIIADLMKVEKSKIDTVDKKKMKLEMKKEVWEDMNAKLYTFYTKQVFDFKSSGTYKTKSATSSNESAVLAKATTAAIAGSHEIEVTRLARGAHLYSEEVANASVTASGDMSFDLSDGTTSATITLSSGASISDFVEAINDTDLNIQASYDSTNKRILLNSTQMGDTSRIQFSNLDIAAETDFFTAVGFTVDTGTVDEEDAIYGAIGQNSSYKYNGMTLSAASNSVSVNGLNLTLKAETTSAVSVSVSNSTDSVYTRVKEFLTAYNTLVDDINTKLTAESNEYEPLTDEEKESLDDTTIENWEAKIKEALFRRDDKLTSITREMRSIMTSSNGVDVSALPDGFQYLSDIGITTGGYAEQGLLHIEGDEEDSLYSGKENRLKKAIEENPDKVAELLTAVGNKLYTMLNDKMKSTTLNSALTFYNDKQIKSQITEYEDKIDDLEERMETVRVRYTKQFAAMEQIIQKANTQSASLLSMLGGSSS